MSERGTQRKCFTTSLNPRVSLNVFNVFYNMEQPFFFNSLANPTVKFHDLFLLPLYPQGTLHSVLHHKFLFVLHLDLDPSP